MFFTGEIKSRAALLLVCMMCDVRINADLFHDSACFYRRPTSERNIMLLNASHTLVLFVSLSLVCLEVCQELWITELYTHTRSVGDADR